MKKLTFLFFLSLVSLAAGAQKKLHPAQTVVEWADKPGLHSVPPEYASEPAIILQRDIDVDYKVEGRSTNVYYTVHTLVKVLDEKGIESFNTIGIPVGRRTRVPLIRARTISPSGKVVDIAKNMIKVTKDESGYYKIVIAMEGVEKNAEIELLVKEIKSYSAFGSEYFQFSVPVLKSHLSVSYPRDFAFEEKGYNGFPDVKETMEHNRKHINVTLSDVPPLERERYSYYDLHRMRVEYRVHHFTDANENDFSEQYTWDDLGRRIFDNVYKISNKERAAVNKYLTELGVHPGDGEADNIRKIENGIKNGISLYAYVEGDSSEVLDTVIKNRAASPGSYLRLFAACFTQAEINHELGMAGDHSEYLLDPKFENWDNLDYNVFYFPNQDKFLYPMGVYYRYPIVPEALLGCKGVFCTIPPKGVITGSLMELRTIKPISAKQSALNVAAGVSFTDDMDPTVDVSYAYTGYQATGIRTEILTEHKDKEKDLVQRVITFADRKEDILKYTISNEAVENQNSNKPLEITATVNTPLLVSKAGDRYLFRIGALTGNQTQLYDERKPRVMPVDMAYPSLETHTITVSIPPGYKLKNPEILKSHAEYVDRSLKPVLSFDATYTLTTDRKKGDKLVVTVNEYYPVMHIPLAEYDRFKEVVNAAADYDKLVLLIEKDKSYRSGKHKAKVQPVVKK